MGGILIINCNNKKVEQVEQDKLLCKLQIANVIKEHFEFYKYTRNFERLLFCIGSTDKKRCALVQIQKNLVEAIFVTKIDYCESKY